MKLLNIDQVAPTSTKVIVIGGVEYAIQPISVGAFLKITKEAEEYVAAGVMNPQKEIQMVIDLAAQCIPAAPREVLESLTLPQLQAIADYVQRDDVDGAEDVEGNA